jgi:transcription elongation GreA/GreB family factor
VTRASKEALHAALCVLLRGELDAAIRVHKTAKEGATHSEARPENDKDTRALEQSYVARGQAMRVRDLELALTTTEKMLLRAFADGDPVALGAVVVTSEEDVETIFMLAPHGGGHTIGRIKIVTPEAPLGRALLGKHVGDTCEVMLAGKRRTLTIECIE